MKGLHDLDLFVRTAHAGSLSAAARQLNLTPAAASAAIKRLEAELGVVLFLRSTRRLRLTLEGESYLQHCEQALTILQDARQALHSGRQVISGTVQLTMPSDLGRNRVLPLLDQFQQQHPDVHLQLRLSDRLADIYSQPVDLALRYGEPPESSLVALPVVADNRRVLVATPGYLERHGHPQTLDELAQHNCLCYMRGDYYHDRWRFFADDGQETSVPVRGDRVTDDGDAVRRWVLAGCGVAYKSTLDISQELARGHLIRLCPQWQGEPAPLNLVCADRRQLSPTVRALHQFLVSQLRD
ncbi:MAG: LysR family transcriptional regulator [Pseudomonadales bacterium]|nr:LysR family transcriptional regulator [Pseudomonadales bacterium]